MNNVSYSDSEDEIVSSSSEFDRETESDDEYFSKHAYDKFEWKKLCEPTDCEPPVFTADAGIKVNIANDCNVIDLFELFFNGELTNLIVVNTNLKASTKLSESDREQLDWTDATPHDIKALVALMLYNTAGASKTAMSRSYIQRLFLIMRCIAFCNDISSSSTLLKTKALVDFTRKKFKEVLIPERKILIQSRVAIGQDRSQLTKNCYSIETYVLCDTSSNYIWNFLLRLTHPKNTTKCTNFQEKIITPLMKDLFGKGYYLYTMNYFNNMEIALYMREQQTGYIGMLMKYVKNIPRELLTKKVKVGEFDYLYEKSGRFVLLKWGAKYKSPIILSTFHKADETAVMIKKGEDKQVPKLVAEYETIDKNIIFDQDILTSFPFEKCFKIDVIKMFRHIVNMMVSNAHAIHRKRGGNLSQRSFMIRVANELEKKYVP